MAKNVLLIEYEQRDRNRVRSLLGPPEFEVTEAHDGEEGLEAFSAGRFDLVLLCGKLPRMGSADVIREIRNKGGAAAPPIVLLMTGYSGSNTKADAQRIGAFEIVPKPFPDDALVAAVRSALGATDQAGKAARSAVTSRLTSNDIFSDLLDELGRDSGAPAPRPASRPPGPAPKPPAPAIEDEMERRLRDTLSGVSLKTRPSVPASPKAAPPDQPPAASKPAAPVSAGADIDRMLTETLRIKIPKKPAAATSSGAAAPAEATPTPSRRAEPREAVSREGPDRFGQYELLERIASGGMAELFRARRTGVEGFQKIVAIKKILPHIAGNDEFITMFADEAKLAAQLNHPNIVHIYDLGKIEAGGYFIAMEYVEGMDLRTILRSARDSNLPLPVPLAVYVASKVASALDYAHRRRDGRGEELRIVHRDVSPQNILISHEGEIKLCDFGIAKADRKVSKTETGSLKGKLQYMSPEQAWGKSIDLRSDLFSLGCVLHEMLTGERLFRGDSDMTVLELVRKAEVGPPSRVNPDVPAALDAVVIRALAREPEERYTTGAEMLRDLETVLYSYTPAPGGADLAIYVNRLREAQAFRRCRICGGRREGGCPAGAVQAGAGQAVAATRRACRCGNSSNPGGRPTGGGRGSLRVFLARADRGGEVEAPPHLHRNRRRPRDRRAAGPRPRPQERPARFRDGAAARVDAVAGRLDPSPRGRGCADRAAARLEGNRAGSSAPARRQTRGDPEGRPSDPDSGAPADERARRPSHRGTDRETGTHGAPSAADRASSRADRRRRGPRGAPADSGARARRAPARPPGGAGRPRRTRPRRRRADARRAPADPLSADGAAAEGLGPRRDSRARQRERHVSDARPEGPRGADRDRLDRARRGAGLAVPARDEGRHSRKDVAYGGGGRKAVSSLTRGIN